MTDYKALYEQQLQENKKLLKRLTNNTKLIRKLNDKVKYLENEVCRYSNAIEEEYVLKTDYDELLQEKHEVEINSVECHCDHCNMWLSYDDLNISFDVGHRCCEMCFEENKHKEKSVCEETEEEEEEEEEEVKEKIFKDICIHCDRKKTGPADMFIIHQDCDGPQEEWCGECYMIVERYKLKSYP